MNRPSDRAIASVNAKTASLEAENANLKKTIALKARMDKIEQMLMKKYTTKSIGGHCFQC